MPVMVGGYCAQVTRSVQAVSASMTRRKHVLGAGTRLAQVPSCMVGAVATIVILAYHQKACRGYTAWECRTLSVFTDTYVSRVVCGSLLAFYYKYTRFTDMLPGFTFDTASPESHC